MEKEIIWSKSAKKQLQEIYFYTLKTSKSNTTSNKLIDAIYNSVKILHSNWEIYELDEMKISNDGIIALTKFSAIVFPIKLCLK